MSPQRSGGSAGISSLPPVAPSNPSSHSSSSSPPIPTPSTTVHRSICCCLVARKRGEWTSDPRASSSWIVAIPTRTHPPADIALPSPSPSPQGTITRLHCLLLDSGVTLARHASHIRVAHRPPWRCACCQLTLCRSPRTGRVAAARLSRLPDLIKTSPGQRRTSTAQRSFPQRRFRKHQQRLLCRGDAQAMEGGPGFRTCQLGRLLFWHGERYPQPGRFPPTSLTHASPRRRSPRRCLWHEWRSCGRSSESEFSLARVLEII